MKNLLDIWRGERMNPLREFTSIQRQMDRLMDRFFDSAPNAFANLPSLIERPDVDFIPACDFEEGTNAYHITVDVPGLTKDQLNVELRGKNLYISGEQNEERKEGKGAHKYYERFHGRFERTFYLPDALDSDEVVAEYKDGVLHISVPRAEAAKSQKVQITEGKRTPLPRTAAKAEEKRESKTDEKAA